MRRRDFIAGVIWAAAPSSAVAVSNTNVQRLAIYSPATPNAGLHEGSEATPAVRVFFEELRRLGHVEGQNLRIYRYGKEQNTSVPEDLVAEVIRENPDVIYVGGPGALLFKRATARIPIVAFTTFPIEQGLVQSLAHPGGNITGVSTDAGVSIQAKRIALLREIFPAISKLVYLQQQGSIQGPVIRAASDALGIPSVGLFFEPASDEAAYRNAIAQATREGANAVLVAENAGMIENRVLIARLIGEVGIPAIYSFAPAVDAGGLMAYSADFAELSKRAASQIDAVLRGVSPSDIPFFQSSKFEFSINLKTAKALGLTVPPALLATADRVVE
jgi:putative tryptophan/tyrosine transport system substrate-binding protein